MTHRYQTAQKEPSVFCLFVFFGAINLAQAIFLIS